LPAWLKQRRRWIKGHMQTWAVLMREPRRVMRELGFWPFVSMQLILGGGLLAAFAHGPLQALLVWTALDAGIAFAPELWVLALSCYVVAIYNEAAAAWLQRDWRMGFTALTMPLYWPLASIAAFFALLSFVFRPHFWAKTEHGLTARTAHAPQAP
jgi:cellulose synthase/poly-beta-1,6-N-acetylglucosamine synthase-like glycosyltransferase